MLLFAVNRERIPARRDYLHQFMSCWESRQSLCMTDHMTNSTNSAESKLALWNIELLVWSLLFNGCTWIDRKNAKVNDCINSITDHGLVELEQNTHIRLTLYDRGEHWSSIYACSLSRVLFDRWRWPCCCIAPAACFAAADGHSGRFHSNSRPRLTPAEQTGGKRSVAVLYIDRHKLWQTRLGQV